MTSREMREANQQLLDTAAGLVEEWPEVPTGSVLRCFSRAVWIVRGAGCPPERLPAEAARLACALLELRAAPGARQAAATSALAAWTDVHSMPAADWQPFMS